MLLQDALTSHDGVVLFTTSKPERIGRAVATALAADKAPQGELRAFLAESGLQPAA